MNEMTIENAKYIAYEGVNVTVDCTIDGVELSVPLDPANRHYAAILKAVEVGTLTIQEAS